MKAVHLAGTGHPGMGPLPHRATGVANQRELSALSLAWEVTREMGPVPDVPCGFAGRRAPESEVIP